MIGDRRQEIVIHELKGGDLHVADALAVDVGVGALDGEDLHLLEAAPGEEAEVDFGSVSFYLEGTLVEGWMFVMRLSASGRGFHRIYLNQAQQVFLDGHVRAFAHFGGVPAGQHTVRFTDPSHAMGRVYFGGGRTFPKGDIHRLILKNGITDINTDDAGTRAANLKVAQDSLSQMVDLVDVKADPIIEVTPKNAHLYCCGPAPMLAGFEALDRLGGVHLGRRAQDHRIDIIAGEGLFQLRPRMPRASPRMPPPAPRSSMIAGATR